MRAIAYAFIVLMTSSCATQAKGVRAINALSYELAIQAAEVKPDANRRIELRRCVKNWDAMRAQRKSLGDQDDIASETILLEIGNSGFPRYDYVYVAGTHLSSSFGKQEDISSTNLEKLVRAVFVGSLKDLRGNAWYEAEDGDCYYLTAADSRGRKSVAVYGVPDSTVTGSLIREMLKIIGNKGDGGESKRGGL